MMRPACRYGGRRCEMLDRGAGSAYGSEQEDALLPDVLKELRQHFNVIARKELLKAATVLTNSNITLKPR